MRCRRLCFGLVSCVPLALLAQDPAPVARHYQVRLMGPLGSESQDGSGFLARVIGPLGKHRAGDLPHNTLLHGRVVKARAVGIGLRREQATLQVQFDGCAVPSGDPVPCQVQLVEVDNAREQVRPSNTLKGIVAASHPHSWIGGVWLRPNPMLFGRSMLGLTGASGMLQTRLLANPFAAAGMVGARAVLFRLPDPEIVLPAGTDLILKITAPPVVDETHSCSQDQAPLEISEQTDEVLQTISTEIVPSDGQKVADLINLAFIGSRHEVEQAFAAAGWTAARPFTAATFARTYKAFASMNTYKAAPVSPLTWEGRLPDLVYQKSFNTLAKRHHIRIWSLPLPDGETLWVGAATHDIGVAFDWARLSLTHRVDLRIDRERNLLLNDLADAECIGGLHWMDRPALAAKVQHGGPRTTDGGLAVVKVRACIGSDFTGETRQKLPRAKLAVRRIVLETRQYITRGNPYYYAFRMARWSPFKRHTLPGDEQ